MEHICNAPKPGLHWTLQKQVRIEDWIDDLGEEIQGRLGVTGGDAASQSLTDARCAIVM